MKAEDAGDVVFRILAILVVPGADTGVVRLVTESGDCTCWPEGDGKRTGSMAELSGAVFVSGLALVLMFVVGMPRSMGKPSGSGLIPGIERLNCWFGCMGRSWLEKLFIANPSVDGVDVMSNWD